MSAERLITDGMIEEYRSFIGSSQKAVQLIDAASLARFAVAGMGDVLRPQRQVVRGQHPDLGGECAQMDIE